MKGPKVCPLCQGDYLADTGPGSWLCAGCGCVIQTNEEAAAQLREAEPQGSAVHISRTSRGLAWRVIVQVGATRDELQEAYELAREVGRALDNEAGLLPAQAVN